VSPHQQELTAFTDLLGAPYSGEIDGRFLKDLPAWEVRISVMVETSPPESAALTDFCKWDCFGVLASLESQASELLRVSRTVRYASYSRAVQELSPLVGCAAHQEEGGTWTMFQICCKHEQLFGPNT
jgi:hypothetical protein